MTLRTLSALAASGVLLLGATACGGDDDKAEKETISKADFLKKGNAICEEGGKEIDAESEKLTQESTEAEAIEFIKFAVDRSQEQVDELEDLGYPKGDEKQLKALYTDVREVLDTIEEDPKAAMESESDPFTAINADFKEYGLTDCAE